MQCFHFYLVFTEHWQYIIDENIINLQRTEVDIQSFAIAALRAFANEYYRQTDGTPIPAIQGTVYNSCPESFWKFLMTTMRLSILFLWSTMRMYYNRIYNWTNMRVQRTRTKHAPLTTTLGHPKSTQCNFNSCSFNYKSDYSNDCWLLVYTCYSIALFANFE